MVRRFFTNIGLFILVVVGAFAVVFTPLLGGVDRNLGGSLHLPLHSPILQQVVDVIDGWLAQRTPSLWLAAVLALVALLLVYAIADQLVYTIADLAAHLVHGRAERRQRKAELHWRTQVMAAGEQPSALPASTAEYEALWK
jgi:hypothetical protein